MKRAIEAHDNPGSDRKSGKTSKSDRLCRYYSEECIRLVLREQLEIRPMGVATTIKEYRRYSKLMMMIVIIWGVVLVGILTNART